MNDIKKFSLNKKNKNWAKILWMLILILFFLFILNIFVSPVRNYFLTISSPIQKFLWTAGKSSSGFLGSISNFSNLHQENNKLKEENQNLLYQLAILKSIAKGNREQSNVSLSCQNNNFQLLMAGIIGLNNDVVSISKGSLDGVLENMPVINQQNVLVGRVIKVYKNFSEVILATNKNSLVNVRVQQKPTEIIVETESSSSTPLTITEVDGVIRGEGGLNAYLDLVPVNDEIHAEDVLVTSSLEQYFPKDLLVGKITKIIKNDQEPFQKAEVSLFFDIKKSDNLFIITNYKKE